MSQAADREPSEPTSAAAPASGSPAPGSSAPEQRQPEATRMLILATLGFTLSFWAWNLIGPLGPTFGDELQLSAIQQSLIVAVPVIVGSLGRIPVGALTDRLGGRVMMPLITGLTIIPVLFVGFFGTSYPALLVGGFFLGLGGTSFAVGVPVVNRWYPPSRRGTALGIFGAGTAGTAVSSFSTVPLADALGERAPFLIVAAVLALYAVLARAFLRDAPGLVPAQGSWLSKAWSTFKRRDTLALSWLYAIAFGGFVAFSVYLPTYLVNAYDLEQTDASFRTAGFVVLAVIARPVGGALSDRLGPTKVLVTCYLIAAAAAALAAAQLELLPVGTVAFLTLAVCLGAGQGGVFALVSMRVEPPAVGSVTGIVGAAGGLGGFIPPLVMGAIYESMGHYTLGLALLAILSLLTGLFTLKAFRTPQGAPQ